MKDMFSEWLSALKLAVAHRHMDVVSDLVTAIEHAAAPPCALMLLSENEVRLITSSRELRENYRRINSTPIELEGDDCA